MTVHAGVVGSPARHSLSPLIHGAWLKAAEIDGTYSLFDIAADAFADFLVDAQANGLAGVNVTLPFKEQALNGATDASPDALMAAAANLLLFDGEAIFAHNTDGYGLLAALAEQAPQLSLDKARVVVLGAGGAAKGAVAALSSAGAQVAVVNRTQEKAIRLVDDLKAKAPRAVKLSVSSLATALPDADLVVNATSAGLSGAADGGFDLRPAPANCVVMDMVYKPLETPFLRQAKARGLATVDGLAMLIGQARPSFEALFGRAAPSDVDVRALCLRALNP